MQRSCKPQNERDGDAFVPLVLSYHTVWLYNSITSKLRGQCLFGIFLFFVQNQQTYFISSQQTSGGEPAESPRSTRGETAKEIAERHIQKVTKIQRAWEVLTDDKEYPKCIVRKQQQKSMCQKSYNALTCTKNTGKNKNGSPTRGDDNQVLSRLRKQKQKSKI